MKIEFGTVLTNFADTVVKDAETGKALTLGVVCVNALLSQTQRAGKPLPGAEKLRCANLAEKLYAAAEAGTGLDVKAEDVVLLKEAVGDLYPPLVVKRVWDLLDPSTEGEVKI